MEINRSEFEAEVRLTLGRMDKKMDGAIVKIAGDHIMRAFDAALNSRPAGAVPGQSVGTDNPLLQFERDGWEAVAGELDKRWKKAQSHLKVISGKIEIMLGSAKRLGEGEWVEGYQINTGAVHSIVAELQRAGFPPTLWVEGFNPVEDMPFSPSSVPAGEADIAMTRDWQFEGKNCYYLGDGMGDDLSVRIDANWESDEERQRDIEAIRRLLQSPPPGVPVSVEVLNSAIATLEADGDEHGVAQFLRASLKSAAPQMKDETK